MSSNNPGNPPQGAPGALLKWMATAPWSDARGVLTFPALQWVQRLVNQVLNGILSVQVNGTTESAGVVNFKPGIVGVVNSGTLDLSGISVALNGTLEAGVTEVNFAPGLAGVIAGTTLTVSGIAVQLQGTAEVVNVVNFTGSTRGTAAGGTLTVQGLVIEIGGVVQTSGTLNFGSGISGSTTTDITTVHVP